MKGFDVAFTANGALLLQEQNKRKVFFSMLLEIKGHCHSEFFTGTLLHFQVKALYGQSLRLHFPSSINCQANDPIWNVHFQLHSAASSPLLKRCLTQP